MAEIFKAVIVSDEVVCLNRPEICIPDVVSESSIALSDFELAEIREKSREEAYKAGFQQGLADGLNQAELQSNEIKSKLQTLLDALPEAISANRQQLSAEIADIVLTIVSQFFINQQHNKDAINQQITQILTQLNNKQNIELSLHPKDVALLQQGQIKIDVTQCKSLRLIADGRLRLGGCLIKSEHGVFDAGIERQVDNLKQVLLHIKQGMSNE